MSEIAVAFVRIAADTTGFRKEAEAGVRGAAVGAAKVFAGAFAAVKLFDFGKSAVDEAAQTQKAAENIRAQFKQSADAVLQFGDDAASAFGISRQASEVFSSQIGLAGKNLGLTSKQTAEMNIGFQKLAGSVGLIKGIDPASIFDQLKLALLGNVRGLKQLGISVDTTREKQALLDAGVIKATVNEAAVAKARLAVEAATKTASDAVAKYGKDSSQAAVATNDVQLKQQAYKKALEGTVPPLTAAQKAQAIYLLATKQLPGFLDQAKKHSGDLADQQRKLSAEWANAKEEIGAALLPAVTSLTAGFLDVLHAVERNKGGIRQAFADAGTVLTPLTATVKGLAHNFQIVGPVLAGLVGTFITYKAVTTAASFATGLYSTALRTLNTVAILATGGTGALADAQDAQALATASQAARIEAAAAAQVAAQDQIQFSVASTVAAYQAASDGIISSQTAIAVASQGAADAAIASSAEVVAAEAAATAETEVLTTTLATNPFGLLALGVSAVVGGLIGYKTLTGDASSSTDQMTQSFKDAKAASDDLKAALDGLTSGHLDLKQANLDTKDAADQLTTDQRALNKIVDAGGKGTQKYRDALEKVQRDEIGLGRAQQERHRALNEIADNTAKATKANNEYLNSIHSAGQAALDATAPTAQQIQNLNRVGTASQKAAFQQQRLRDAADLFAQAQDKQSAADLRLAAANQKTNPQLAERERRFAALSQGAADLATKLGRIPTTHEINVFYRNNIQRLRDEAQRLRDDINNLPLSKTITIDIVRRTSGNVDTRKAAGGPIAAGALALTGEAGPELSISKVGRQIISKSDTAGLFREIGSGLTAVAQALEQQAQRTIGVAAGVAFNAPVTIETPNPGDFLKQLAALVPTR